MSSARSSWLSRILRSASFRLTLIYAALFVVSAVVLFATVYVQATNAMQNDMQAVLRTEAFQLAEIHRRAGLLGVADQITRRMNFRTRGPIYYLLEAPTQQVVVGNLPGMPPVNGVIDFVPERDTAEAENERPKLNGYGLTLSDGSFLLVAQDANRLGDMQRAIISAFAWAGGLTLLLAIAGGAWLGNTFLRRIDTITRTSRAIMEGDLTARVPVRGHLLADLDPLSDAMGKEPAYHPELDPLTYGLTIWDLDREFITGTLGHALDSQATGQQVATLRDILDQLRRTYCGKIGCEYMNIQHPEQKRWLQQRMEPQTNAWPLDETAQTRILENLFLPEVPVWFVLLILGLLANRQMGLLEGSCADFVASLAEGQRLTLQRVDEMLEASGVRPLSVLGTALDPNCMRVVGVEPVADLAHGTVLRETRRGFFHRGELLRIAEVIVSKKEGSA